MLNKVLIYFAFEAEKLVYKSVEESISTAYRTRW